MIKIFLKKFRAINLLFSWLTILCVAYLCNEMLSSKLVYIFLLASSFLMASNILNDLLDIKTDEINKPYETFIFKKINFIFLYFLVIILYVIGIWSSLYIYPLGRIIAIIFIFPLSIFYTKFFKKLPFIGNIIIGIMTATLFLFTEASLTNKIDMMWIPFLLASLLSIIRELCKDIEDIEGDYKNNIITFPVKFGQLKSIYLLRFMAISFSFFTIFLWIIDYYGNLYLILITLGILLPLFYNIFFIIHINSSKIDFSNSSKNLKILSGLGILIIFFSELNLLT